MKKKVISIFLVVALVAIAAVGTLAYFTDTDEAENVFTVGNVDIRLIESTLHRVNAGQAPAEPTVDNPLVSKVAMEGTAAAYTYGGPYWNGDCYSDAQIEADAETYQDYLAEFGTIDPGEHVKKMPYVVNDGTNDAYIRIRVIIPAGLDELLDDSYYTGTAVENKEFTYEKKSDGTNNIYEFTRIEPLASDEMTFFNVWGSIAMDKDVTNEDIAAAKEAGLISEDGTFSIQVEADGIQSASFDSAADAWAAFDAESAA